MNVLRSNVRLSPDQSRVVLRTLRFGTDAEYQRILHRILSMPEADVIHQLDEVLSGYGPRHRHLDDRFLARFRQLEHLMPPVGEPSAARKRLIGSYFLFEYSIESAGLFNPSILPHPDQSGLPAGALRFLLSLRSTGEGHISSISFRTGVIDAKRRITIDTPSRTLTEPDLIENPSYHKGLFCRKVAEMGLSGELTDRIMGQLPDPFSLSQLRDSLRETPGQVGGRRFEDHPVAGGLWLLAKCNYEIQFSPEQDISECVILPVTPLQSNGIEDVRLVALREDDGKIDYFATYTAYDGRNVLPQMFVTEDFRHFKFTTLNGPGARNKGMALFPRKINGHYVMLSRQDGDSLYLTQSDNVHFWPETRKIVEPFYSWEFTKIGNCGSPIETEAGWLVITHGVGPMRQYDLGAVLLDLQDPTKVLARLREPLMVPQASEREGYVPNVLYTCGGLLHGNDLILPYAFADRVTSFATVPLRSILIAMA